MLADSSTIHDVLTDVMIRGAAVVDKKKLLYALGAKQDRQSVWKRLLDAWEDLEMPRGALRGQEIWGITIVLTSQNDPKIDVAFVPVTDWE